MKKMWGKGILIVMASAMISLTTISSGYAQASVSLQVFYDELAPYGTWMQHNQYGYVWIPSVDAGFTPYGTNGYWVNTSYGNTWVSDYSWGWAPFHYGRWFYDDFHGWLWVPDTEWAPAWVTWRSGGGYYGWAPLMPGWGFHVSVGYYDRIPHRYWNFVPYRYVMYRSVYRHCLPRPRVVNVIHHTTIINNYHRDGRDRGRYFTGPERGEIERRNRERVPVYNVSEQGRPGRTQVGRNSVNIYKPQVDDSRTGRSRAMPSKVIEDRRDNDRVIESRTSNGLRTDENNTRDFRSNENSNQRTVPQRDSRFNTLENDRNNFQREQNENADRLRRSGVDEQKLDQRERIQNTERLQRTQPEQQRFQQREPAKNFERPGNLPQQRTTEKRQFSQPQSQQRTVTRPEVKPMQQNRTVSPQRNSGQQVQRQSIQRQSIQRNSSPTRSGGNTSSQPRRRVN